MRSYGLSALLLLASTACGNIVNEIDDSYDFVIVGGGLAGLVLGARLSEDEQHSVLVLEAGPTGDDQADLINVPANTYYEDMWDSPINWQFQTVAQPNVNGTPLEWPRGKVLGGSSAINGLYFTRPGEIEIEAWRNLLGDMEGADNWSWDTMFAGMKKSQTFSAPTENPENAITWDEASQGTDGPISASYPGYMLDMTGDWCTANNAAGVSTSGDTYGGESWGCYISTSAINPANWTRSYSRTGYLDALPSRDNYAVLANAQVTRLIFDDSSADNITANAVEYTSDGGATTLKVKVAKEVILAGGSVGSPVVLMNSGVGPKDVLDTAGVEIVHELPGVGEHLQDHLSVYTQWKTNEKTAGTLHENGQSDAAFMSLVNDAVAYADAATIFGDGVDALTSSVSADLDQYAPADSTVAAGYSAISKASLGLFDTKIGQIELLMGTNEENIVSLGASIQHPFSQGRITIGSSNPLDTPIIDPMYLSNPADAQVLVAGLKLARQIGESAPFSDYLVESWPGTQVQSDDDWDKWMRENVFTNYHPASTCAMLPLDQGGVVDGNLRVYGLSNVRVADASVPPFVFSAHLMSSTYGLAEQASTIIRNEWKKKAQLTSALATHSSSHNKGSGQDHQSGASDDSDSGSSSENDKDSSDGEKSAATNIKGSPSVAMAAFVMVVTYAIFAF